MKDNSMDSTTYSVNLTRVNQPGKVSLELKGSILVIHRENWVSKYSLFVPVEIVEIDHGKHRNYRKLWQGILGLMIAFLLALPLSLWFVYRPLFYISDLIWTIPLIGLFIFSLTVGCLGLFQFSKLNPTINFSFYHRSNYVRMAFWIKPEILATLDRFIKRINELKRIMEVEGYTPLNVCPMWFRTKPYRRALLTGMMVSFVLFCIITLFLVMQVAMGYPEKMWWIYAILPVPPVVYVISAYLRRQILWGIPKAFKRARKAFEKENYSSAVEELQNILKEHPDLSIARFLLIQILTENGKFDDALQQCEEFYLQEPSLATELKTTVWWFRCLKERMEYTPQEIKDGG